MWLLSDSTLKKQKKIHSNPGWTALLSQVILAADWSDAKGVNWSGRSSSRGQRDNQHSLSVGRTSGLMIYPAHTSFRKQKTKAKDHRVVNLIGSRWFKVTFWFPSWRSPTTFPNGHLHSQSQKRAQSQNCQVSRVWLLAVANLTCNLSCFSKRSCSCWRILHPKQCAADTVIFEVFIPWMELQHWSEVLISTLGWVGYLWCILSKL